MTTDRPSKLSERRVLTGTFRYTPRMAELMAGIFERGLISYGPVSKEFEREFALVHGCRYAILSNSGTSSLHVAVQALKETQRWKDGDEVLVPALTFPATVNVVLHNRLKPVLVDVDPFTYTINPSTLDDSIITPRTVGIIPVHLFGQAADMQSISEAAAAYGLSVIEDACEAAFAQHNGFPVGSFGAIGCFSTYVAHLLTTGVGGMATTNDPQLAARMRSLVNHGLDIAQLNADENFSPRPMLNRRFRFTSVGHSFRITEMEAALGLAQLETAGAMLRTRARNAAHLRAKLSFVNDHYGAKLRLPTTAHENRHSWMMFPIVCERDEKESLTKALNAAGIETRDMLPLTDQPCYAEWCREDDYPVSKFINGHGFYIGCHQDLEPEDIEYVAQVFEDYYQAAREDR